MSTINELHRKAMDLAALAFKERLYGNDKESLSLFQEALEFECAAIDAMDSLNEPTYSVLHRSAAMLALDCNEIRRAERLAHRALAEEPPHAIAEELREVLDQVKARAFMEQSKIEISGDEIQLSLDGPSVGLGFANLKDVLGRIESLTKLVVRTAERLMEVPFRERGQPGRIVRDYFQPWVSVPKAGSFAIDIRFISSTGQMSFPEVAITGGVMNEFMDTMEMIERADLPEIQGRISDHAYLSNFLGLARSITPDGRKIKRVGLTTAGAGAQRSLLLTKVTAEIPLPPPTEPAFVVPELVNIQGTLRYADAVDQNRHNIKLIDAEGTAHDIRVPVGMLDVLVPSHWEQPVIVTAMRAGGVIELAGIGEADDALLSV